MFSSEILPPVQIEDKESIIGISVNYKNKEITISHHTNAIGEIDKEKKRYSSDFKSITIPVEQLKWLASRLRGLRESFNIEDGYEIKKK